MNFSFKKNKNNLRRIEVRKTEQKSYTVIVHLENYFVGQNWEWGILTYLKLNINKTLSLIRWFKNLILICRWGKKNLL